MNYYDILTGVHIASRYKVARTLRAKKANEVAFVLEVMYNKGDIFKYPTVFQFNNASKFKSDVTKLIEKHNAGILTATIKYKHIQSFCRSLAQRVGKTVIKAHGWSRSTKAVWIKNLNSVVNKMKNTKSLKIEMTLKYAIKLHIVDYDDEDDDLFL